MSNKSKYTDRDFQELAAKINQAIIENEGLIGDQKAQVELVISLERKFKHMICKYSKTVSIYKQFIQFITVENNNILSAKPYFRERSDVFNSGIAKALKENDPEALMQYNINYRLIDFIVSRWNGPIPEKANNYYLDFLEARRILIENNLPLAINRAKLFYRKTPRSHLGLLDLIDICICGLISGVDKYEGEYRKQWRSVCIGMMVGYMIQEYSKTFLRMYPNDKKILYRANSLKYRLKIEKTDELTKAVNESFDKDKADGKKVPPLPITETHVRTLLNGSSHISVDSKIGGDSEEEGSGIYDYTPDPKQNVEQTAIKNDIMRQVSGASKELHLVERKIIRLKGVDL